MSAGGDARSSTVPEMLQDDVRRFGDSTALIAASLGRVDELRSITYAEFDASARRVAAGLRQQGVGKGQRVGILLDNSCAVEAQTVYHAVHLLGAINVPLNTRFVPAELAHAVRLAGISVLMADARLRETVEAVIGLDGNEGLLLVGVTGPESGVGVSWTSLSTARPMPGAAAVTATDDADWIFTSGTTGSPKAARFTHAASVACGTGVRQAWGLRPGDVYQSSAPFFTSTGIHTNPLGVLSAGATYLVDPEPSLEAFVDRAEAHGTTVCFLVTTMLRLLVDEYRAALPRLRLRRVVYGGMAIPETAHRRLHEVLTGELGIELVHLMGLTEGGPTGLYLRPADQARKPGSIGNRPFSDEVEFRVVGDDGHPVPAGTVGELSFRGPSVMSGYVQEGGAAPGLVDGWLRTGDLVRQDEDGYVFFEDRTKDIVRRGGLNISSAEVESVLSLAPGVKAAAVVPKPHEVLGEDLCAYVEVDGADLDVERLRDFCREHLATFKIPRDIRVVDELPRNAMGRVVKASLRTAVGPVAGTGTTVV